MNDQMRDAFEGYRDKRNAKLEAEGHKPGSKWHIDNAHYATWQASRAALCVELPARIIKQNGYTEDDEYFNAAIDACERAIQKTGVRVK